MTHNDYTKFLAIAAALPNKFNIDLNFAFIKDILEVAKAAVRNQNQLLKDGYEIDPVLGKDFYFENSNKNKYYHVRAIAKWNTISYFKFIASSELFMSYEQMINVTPKHI
jgi:hypothetical protein